MSPTREQRAASAIRSLAKEADLQEVLDMTLDTLDEIGVSKRDLALAVMDRVGGILGAKEVAERLSSHTVKVASTNIARVTPGLEPVGTASGNAPLYLGVEVEPHRQRLWKYREDQRIRREQENAMDSGDLVPVPRRFTGGRAG